MPAMKEKFAGVDRYRHFINGQWVDSTAKEWIEVGTFDTVTAAARRIPRA